MSKEKILFFIRGVLLFAVISVCYLLCYIGVSMLFQGVGPVCEALSQHTFSLADLSWRSVLP